MILTSLIAASGHGVAPAAEAPPPEPIDAIVGAPKANGATDFGRRFEAANILAQRYTTGVAGKIVGLLAYLHGTGTPNFRMSVYSDVDSLPQDLLEWFADGFRAKADWGRVRLSRAAAREWTMLRAYSADLRARAGGLRAGRGDPLRLAEAGPRGEPARGQAARKNAG